MGETNFKDALSGIKIPILVLDQKWHRLFALSGKPQEVVILEKNVNELLARQGKLNQELKEYKKVKNTLMQNIVENMEGTHEDSKNDLMSKKLEEDRRLIDEANDKLAEIEDELLEIPKKIKDANEMLMMETMGFCYQKLRTNTVEADEISQWIKKIRVELKKNIIRKQNREINNREIYSYMHDIFGKDVINLFDVRYEDFEQKTENNKDTVDESKNQTTES